jgi:hypothetical protein
MQSCEQAHGTNQSASVKRAHRMRECNVTQVTQAPAGQPIG